VAGSCCNACNKKHPLYCNKSSHFTAEKSICFTGKCLWILLQPLQQSAFVAGVAAVVKWVPDYEGSGGPAGSKVATLLPAGHFTTSNHSTTCVNKRPLY
jgi:hypothetical protein